MVSLIYQEIEKNDTKGTKESVEMKVVEVKNIESKPNPHGVDARSISDTKNAQISHIALGVFS